MIKDKEKLRREKIIQKKCKEKGWSSKDLTTNQMLYIAKKF